MGCGVGKSAERGWQHLGHCTASFPFQSSFDSQAEVEWGLIKVVAPTVTIVIVIERWSEGLFAGVDGIPKRATATASGTCQWLQFGQEIRARQPLL